MLIFGSIAVAFFLIAVGGFLFGHDHDPDHDHSFDQGVSFFSTKVLATFGMGFGAAGAVASYYGAGYLPASGIGVLAGFLLAGAMYLFISLVSRQQASSLVETSSLVGQTGTVTIGIEKDSVGEVAVSSAGGYVSYAARAQSNSPIAKGRPIRVVKTAGSLLIVGEVE